MDSSSGPTRDTHGVITGQIGHADTAQSLEEQYIGYRRRLRSLPHRSGRQYHGNIKQPDPRKLKSLDLVKRLPPEVSLLCIQEALPQGDHVSQLLELASISQAWENFVFSASILWTDIHAEWSKHDLLATIATCTHLSGTRPIELTVWEHPKGKWSDVIPLLLPHYQRIHSLTVRSIYDASGEPPHLTRARYASTLSTTLTTLNLLPQLRHLSFDQPLEFLPSQLQALKLPSGTRLASNVDLPAWKSDSNHGCLSMVTEATIYEHLDSITDAMKFLLSLSKLTLDGIAYKENESTVSIPMGSLPCLRNLTYQQPYNSIAAQLIRTTAFQLSRLSLRIFSSQVEDLVDLLKIIPGLRELSLFIPVVTSHQNASFTSCGVIIQGMRKLELQVAGFTEEMVLDHRGSFLSLFAAFTILYPNVGHLSIRGVSIRTPYVISYIKSLAGLDVLFLHDLEDKLPVPPLITLSRLSELSLDSPSSLWYFRLPNLLRLDISSSTSSEQLAGFSLQTLRKLYICPINSPTGCCQLNPREYPNLKELYLEPPHKWKASSLPQLVSVTFTPSYIMNAQCANFCIELIYDPECCPCLREIHFNDFVDWDVLFFMLERRNFGLIGVKKIQEITVPFVPVDHRASLKLLLEGRQMRKSSKYPRSLEVTRDVVCNTAIPGCISCLRYMWPECSVEVTEYIEQSTDWKNIKNLSRNKKRVVLFPQNLELDDIFPEHGYPQHATPIEARRWLSEYGNLVRKWKSSFGEFQRRFFRPPKCDRYLPL